MEHSLGFEDPNIEIYLTAVERSMPNVPPDRRTALLSELHSHISQLAADAEAAGASRSQAVSSSLSTMGPAKSIGRRYSAMWRRRSESGSVLAAFGVITAVGVIGSLFVTPHLLVLDTLAGNRWDWSTTVQSTSMVAGPIALGGLLAGWFMPRGAVKAAGIRAALTICFTLLMLVFPPHETQSVLLLQLENAFAGGAACIAGALVGREFYRRLNFGPRVGEEAYHG